MFYKIKNCEYLIKKGDRVVCACTEKSCRITRLWDLCKMGFSDIDIYKNDTAPLKKMKKNIAKEKQVERYFDKKK